MCDDREGLIVHHTEQSGDAARLEDEPQFDEGHFARVFSGLSLARIARYMTMPITAKVNAYFLGVTGVGVMSQINVLLGQSSSLALHGVGDGATKLISRAAGRDCTENNEEVQQIVGTVLYYTTAISLLFVGVVYVAANPLARVLMNDQRMAPLLVIAALSFPVVILNELYAITLRGLSRFQTLSVNVIVSSIAGLFVIVPLVVAWQLTGAALALVIGGFAGLICILVLAWRDPIFRRVRPFGRLRLSRPVVSDLARYMGSTLIMGLLAPILVLTARSVMVRQIGVEGIGIYAPVIVFSGLVLEILGIPLNTILLPAIAKHTSHAAISGELNRLLRMACIAVLCIASGILVFRSLLVTLLYDSRFSVAAQVMGPHVVGVALNVLAGGIGMLYFALPRLKALIVVDFIAKISLIVFIYLFGRLWGLWGVSLAYLAMYVLGFALNYAYFRHEIGFTFSTDFLRAAVPAFATLAVLSVVPLATWSQMALALGVVGCVAYMLLSADERRALMFVGSAVGRRIAERVRAR